MAAAITKTRFVLWREVLFAYLAPAICAGAGGLITGRADLMVAALTSIAGTSAVVALAIGMWLQHRGIRYPRLRRTTPVRLAVASGIGAVVVAVALTQLLGSVAQLPNRLSVDVPIAALIATVITTARWSSTYRKEDR
ncbi:hypothetical protein ACFXHA_33205 [Nocardia sp. NPDC059240]|uniref:hypothetical protein n=1 Tax=Nocardia sp. NPDC059240 TaxID=3346786 RepID=UPI0036C3F8DF